MKKNRAVFMMFIFISMSIKCVPALYIPSYDDRYQEDIEQAKGNKSCSVEPDDKLNYANYRYLGAHAAEKYPRFFPEYSLQSQSIIGMLHAGVRGLMLSAYNWSLGWSTITREGISVVCSHPMKESAVFRQNGKPLYQTLHYEMNRIFNFLKTHPQAVITILLEDFADITKITRDLREIIMKNSYDPILRPSDWPAAQQKGEWPTLGWMRKNNKRLLLFTQTYDNHTLATWPAKHYFWQNVYGTLNEDLICVEERESILENSRKNRKLVGFNVFGSVAVSLSARNPLRCLDYDVAKRLTSTCQQKGFAAGKLFNGYWVDHIIEGLDILRKEGKKTACDYINELNATGSR